MALSLASREGSGADKESGGSLAVCIATGSLVLELRARRSLIDILRPESVEHVVERPDGVDVVVEVRDDYRPVASWRQSAESADGVFVVSGDPASRRLRARSLFWEADVDLGANKVSAGLRRFDAQSLEALLKTLVQAFALACEKGAVVHASAVQRGGACVLFVGPSGAGKSTAAAVLEQAGHCRVLTDDVTFVSSSDGEPPTVVTLPFRQRFEHLSRKARARVKAVYELRQSDHHAVEELTGPARVAAVARSVAVGARTPMLAAPALDAAERLASLVPVYRLRFSRDAGFWDIVEPVLRDEGAGSLSG